MNFYVKSMSQCKDYTQENMFLFMLLCNMLLSYAIINFLVAKVVNFIIEVKCSYLQYVKVELNYIKFLISLKMKMIYYGYSQ